MQNKVELISNQTVEREQDALVSHSLSFMSINKMARQDSSTSNFRFEVEKLSTIFDHAQSDIVNLLNNDTFNRFAIIISVQARHEQ